MSRRRQGVAKPHGFLCYTQDLGSSVGRHPARPGDCFGGSCMLEDKDGISDFKVVDRRSFAEDGSRRAPAPEAEKRSEVRQPPATAKPNALPLESRGGVESEPRTEE